MRPTPPAKLIEVPCFRNPAQTQNKENTAHPTYRASREEVTHNVNGCIYRSRMPPRLGRAANPPAVSLRVSVEPLVKPDDSAVCLVPVQTAVCSSRATGLVAHIPQCRHWTPTQDSSLLKSSSLCRSEGKASGISGSRPAGLFFNAAKKAWLS